MTKQKGMQAKLRRKFWIKCNRGPTKTSEPLGCRIQVGSDLTEVRTYAMVDGSQIIIRVSASLP